MKKQLLIVLSFFSALNGMEPAPIIQAPQQTKHFDMWDFFSEPNSLDKLGKPILIWDKNCAKDGCSARAIANLHILTNSSLSTNSKKILELGCEKGHVSAFLAHNSTATIWSYADNGNDIAYVNKKYKLKNLTLSENFCSLAKENFYDLAVICAPLADMEKLQLLRMLLKPKGELFCIFSTHSNAMPLATEVLHELFPKIKKCFYCYEEWKFTNFVEAEKKEYLMDEELKNMITQAGFDVITFEQQNFTIAIKDVQKFKDFHKSLVDGLPIMKAISSQKKREKIAIGFIGRMMKKLEEKEWIYPFSKTVIHIRKTK